MFNDLHQHFLYFQLPRDETDFMLSLPPAAGKIYRQTHYINPKFCTVIMYSIRQHINLNAFSAPTLRIDPLLYCYFNGQQTFKCITDLKKKKKNINLTVCNAPRTCQPVAIYIYYFLHAVYDRVFLSATANVNFTTSVCSAFVFRDKIV